jgi:hypothetical protein
MADGTPRHPKPSVNPGKRGQFRQSSDKTLAPGRWRVQAAGGAAAMGRSKNEVRRCEIVTDPRQDNLEVGACVAIHVA